MIDIEELSKAVRVKLSDWDVEIPEIRRCLEYLLERNIEVDEKIA